MDIVIESKGLIYWQLSGLIYLGFWAYALIDCVRNEFRGPNQKLIWLILILFAPFIGTFLYLSMSRRTKEKRRFQPDFNSKIP
ncbi:PLDc N-terminal domain-containing protein [Algoriphagus sp. AK58]|uniref:PLDc N-terminal domain-containing protein n=1 Tax=Algoriphagus sp. AK58 TaxID=1406877 RepID=UPI00164EDBDF|nr:PLDc N-terminal domain-containing protein [Algoriphagus sp. AK58]MBC6365451.1 hypothetical protein [Algoriphagus sp. AK58]